MKKRISSKTKISLSLLSVLILILAYLLLPKVNKKNNISYIEPGYSVRRIPAPTPETTTAETNSILVVNSQPPSNTLTISEVNFGESGYVTIFNNEEEVGRSEMLSGLYEDFIITLAKETNDSDNLKVILYDEANSEVAFKNVLILTTAVSPGIILPKDLQ